MYANDAVQIFQTINQETRRPPALNTVLPILIQAFISFFEDYCIIYLPNTESASVPQWYRCLWTIIRPVYTRLTAVRETTVITGCLMQLQIWLKILGFRSLGEVSPKVPG